MVLNHLEEYISLVPDEAYYWGWAQHFDFGYYSKPPMVAWLTLIGTWLFGDGYLGIKSMSFIVYIFTTLNIFYLARELFRNDKIAFYGALAFITLPGVSLSSLIISTDVPFLFFWSLAMLFFVKAIKSNSWHHWLLAGITAGCGLLSKYTMIIFLLSALCYLYLSVYRYHLKNPRFYVAILLAALIYLPNLYWNYTHHFVSFHHTVNENAHITGIHLHFKKMLEFVLSQFAIFGPILFGWLLLLLLRYKELQKEESFKLLWWFIVPMFALILIVSLLSRAYANWAVPMYVASTLLVTAWLILQNRFGWLKAAIGVNIFIALVFYHYHDFARFMNIDLKRKYDPYHRLVGWKELGNQVEKIWQKYPETKLLFDDRKTMAELIYYVHPHPFDALKWNPNHTLNDQYELDRSLKKSQKQDFLFVTERKEIPDVEASFQEVKRVKHIVLPLYVDYEGKYDVYLLKGFQGYKKLPEN